MLLKGAFEAKKLGSMRAALDNLFSNKVYITKYQIQKKTIQTGARGAEPGPWT